MFEECFGTGQSRSMTLATQQAPAAHCGSNCPGSKPSIIRIVAIAVATKIPSDCFPKNLQCLGSMCEPDSGQRRRGELSITLTRLKSDRWSVHGSRLGGLRNRRAGGVASSSIGAITNLRIPGFLNSNGKAHTCENPCMMQMILPSRTDYTHHAAETWTLHNLSDPAIQHDILSLPVSGISPGEGV